MSSDYEKAPALRDDLTIPRRNEIVNFFLLWLERGAVALKWVYKSSGRSNTFLWIACGCLILIKLALVSDLAILMVFSPHDDQLYVSRAYHLLADGTYGPYDSRLLDKLPGLSLLLAAVRRLGIPYLIFLNLLYASAGLYIVEALRRRRLNHWLLLTMFALFLFNPLTLDRLWVQVLRDGADTALLPFLFSAMIFILQGVQRRRVAVFSCLLFSAVFALNLLMREESVMGYVPVLVFDAILLWKGWSWGWIRTVSGRWGLAFLLIFPLAFGAFGKARARAFTQKKYGEPILHEMSEGEYPKLIASMRSVCAQTNRLVQITQDGLRKMRQAVPEMAPLIDRLPPPGKGPNHYSYWRFGISDEWTSGWLNFWIKDAAYQTGRTPDLVTAQKYFREMHTAIDAACQDGRLTCQYDGSGLIPPFRLRLTGALWEELKGIMVMTFKPTVSLVALPPTAYGVTADFGRMYQYVTMTHNFDSLFETKEESAGWNDVPEKYYLSLRYWLRYPDVAMTKDFGPQSPGPEWGAYRHYTEYGQKEGRIWGQRDEGLRTKIMYRNSLAPWRQTLVAGVTRLNGFLWLIGAGFMILRAWTRKLERTPLFWVCVVFLTFVAARSLALAYVSLYMGYVDERLFFPSYTVGLALSVALALETIHLLGATRPFRAALGALARDRKHRAQTLALRRSSPEETRS